MFAAVRYEDGAVVLLDQRRLPAEELYLACTDAESVAAAIRDMVVRGAPAIGVAAAYAIAIGMRAAARTNAELPAEFQRLASLLGATRPTAVNLFWAIERMRRRFEATRAASPDLVAGELLKEAQQIRDEDESACRRMGDLGAELLPAQARVLTHCNAGALATAGYGTALGVIRSASALGKLQAVFADETRPFLQGSRLTAWELLKDGIPTTLIADNMAGHMMATGEVNSIVVGADRIAANGDVANKIGTYPLAVLAKEHAIPFYVVAPVSTFDLATATGSSIPIEERAAEEVTHHAGRRVAAEGVRVRNPAFDVTPHRFVGAIVCERGVARAPYTESLARLAAAEPPR